MSCPWRRAGRMARSAGERIGSADAERLYRAVGLVSDPFEARAFLRDLLSPKEVEELARRLRVATMLRDGASYLEVSRQTGASSTTVSRVSKCLNGEAGGYRRVLARMDGE